MKTFVLGLMVASAMLVSGAVAQAGFVNGGITFGADTQNAGSGTVLDTRNIFDLSKNAGGTLDFRSVANGGFVNTGTAWQNFTLTNPMSNSFSLSSAAFGSFTGTKVSDSLDSGITAGNGNRTIVFTGTFSGGTLFNGSGKQDATLANLTVTLNQSTTLGVTSFSTTINMTAAGLAAPAVPEPASMAIFGLGAIGFAARRFRRK